MKGWICGSVDGVVERRWHGEVTRLGRSPKGVSKCNLLPSVSNDGTGGSGRWREICTSSKFADRAEGGRWVEGGEEVGGGGWVVGALARGLG